MSEQDIKELYKASKAQFDELNVKLEDFIAKYNELSVIQAEHKTLKEQIDELATKLNRKQAPTQDKPVESKEMVAFKEYLREGTKTDVLKQAGPDEGKALYRGDNTLGGYLAPKDYVQEMLRAVVDVSPMRSIVGVRSTSRTAVQIPKRTGTFAAAWLAEKRTQTETTGMTWGMEEVPTFEMAAMVDVSFEDVEDSAFNLEQFITEEFALQFAVAEGIALIKGTGYGQPEGFTVNSDITGAAKETAGSNAIDGNDLKDLFYLLKTPYVPQAVWVMSRSTMKVIDELRGAQEKQYIWNPSLQSETAPVLMGKRIIEAPDMPEGLVDNQYEVALGNFARGFLLVDRLNTVITRDPYTQAASGLIRYTARRRIGGKPIMAEAIKLLKIKA